MRTLVIAALGAVLLAAQAGGSPDIALVGGTVYTDPAAPATPDAVVVVHEGHIRSVGRRSDAPLPAGAEVVDCTGTFITAGFWNSHVHVFTPVLLRESTAPAGELQAELGSMLNRWGFTTVFDVASVLDNTVALRRRIASGELRGPRVLTVGEPLWTKAPAYVREALLANHIDMPAVVSAEDASARVRQLVASRMDGIKIFTGSLQRDGVANMPLEIARAAVTEAHRARLPVFAHPQNSRGLETAIAAGVDVLAHTTPDSPEWTPSFVSRLRAARIALIPTLTLFDFEARTGGESDQARERWLDKMVGELRTFQAGGGEVLFGTDVGYTDHYDTRLEFELMRRAGLDFRAILASLTTVPAARFKAADRSGRIRPDFDADVVVLDADPARDVQNLARVRYTMAAGRFTYRRP